MRTALFIIVLVVLVAIPASQLFANSVNAVCLKEFPSIVISVKDSELHLCNEKSLHKTYAIAIGKKGWGKKKEGDNKTPLGRYVIGSPRPSNKFHVFIPIGYPTPEQKEQGYTGSNIGIHGPWQPLKWLGRMNSLINWTQGCIAVGRNSDIEEISSWVKEKNPEYIYIE